MSKNIKTYSSVADGTESFVLQKLLRETGHPVICITHDDKRMARAAEALRFFAPEITVLTFPAWDCLPYDRVSPHTSIMSQRLVTLSRLATQKHEHKNIVIVTTINAAIQRVPPKALLQDAVLQVTPNTTLSRDSIVRFLLRNGYVQAGKASEPGEYALRGSIVDIFPPGHEDAYRLDFFGDTVETIRTYNPLSQISGGHCKRLDLIPASEILLDNDTITQFRERYRALFGATGRDDPLYEAVSEGRKYAGMEHWLPLFYERLETLFDYVPHATVVCSHLVEEAREERLKHITDYFGARSEGKSGSYGMGTAYHPVDPELLYLQDKHWHNIVTHNAWINLSPFAAPENESVTDCGYRMSRQLVAEAKRRDVSVYELLRETLQGNKPVLLACLSQGARERSTSILESNDIACTHVDDWTHAKNLPRGAVGLMILGLEQGFETDALCVFSEQDLLGERVTFTRRRQGSSEDFLREAASFDEGELVVHMQHGIGRFEGLETLSVDSVQHDCLKIIYDGGDRLFVPVENIDAISRYGSSDESVQLDKLGGLAWQRRTSAIKKRIKVTAQELLEIAAARHIKRGEIFSSTSAEYQEFCARFPYAETEDQLRSIEDVQNDLLSGHPMDRLICGDVGFGKTEVALRAAFLVARGDGTQRGQVAVITPTTLLARQHYKNFTQRFAGFPVTIHQLSRMVPTATAKQTREAIAAGTADIVIGTHALISKQVAFKKLSLLIVDEEQHFGVKQKEHLKRLRAETHVMTLTATPIPRTLQLSLTGVRDLSLITTPPIDRLAVRTYVLPFDGMVIRDAILREHYRGGRTFYVCPRISDLGEVERHLREMVPEVKIAVAHGQMAPTHLDDIMNKFYEGRFDILLSTSIIESGIDIPEANTLVIHRADMFGLAQLYQLRGRVGRSNVRAYAYLTLPARRQPTKQATKRLEVIHTLDTLGAGFSLASHDMDIRGFGNLLGDEQSGNIREVGVELYQQMLKETIERLKNQTPGQPTEAETEPEVSSAQINIGVSVLIPEHYVPDLGLRLSLYKRIAHLETPAEVEDMMAELVDRFGPLPQEVKHLLEVVKIKQLCKEAGVSKLDVGPKGLVVAFHPGAVKNPEKLLRYVAAHPKEIKLRPDQTLFITSSGDWGSLEKKMMIIAQSLREIGAVAA